LFQALAHSDLAHAHCKRKKSASLVESRFLSSVREAREMIGRDSTSVQHHRRYRLLKAVRRTWWIRSSVHLAALVFGARLVGKTGDLSV
jgi:hypothetical protein